MSHRMTFWEFRFVAFLGSALVLLACLAPRTVHARAGSTAGLPAIVHPAASDVLSSASGRAVSGLAFNDPLAPDGSVWSGQKVVVDGGAQADFFGWSVAIEGQTALVGAYGVTVNGNEQQGAVYVFTESNGIWTQTATLTANDGHAFDIFGSEVSISGNVAAIGAYQFDRSRGAVYAFTGSGAAWSQKAKLTADDSAAGDCLGWSVAVSNGTILAGAPFAVVDGIQLGATYSFALTGGVWSQAQKVVPSDGTLGELFGNAIAIDGSNAVIAAESADVNGHQGQGAAYVFDQSGGTWMQKAKLTSDDGAAFDNFGRSVAISASTAFVGAPYVVIDDNAFQGAVYVFDGTDSWQQSQKLTASDGAANDYFGWSVAVSGTGAMVGANSYNDTNPGEVYVFSQSGSAWAQRQQLVSGDGTGVDFFGWSVALSGASNAIVGEPFAMVDGAYAQGAAYFYAPAGDSIFANGFD